MTAEHTIVAERDDVRAPDGATAEELRAAGISWAVDSTVIVDGVDVRVPPGTVTGLLGPNGSGKSSLLRAVAGTTRPDGGAVTLGQDDLLSMRRKDRARRVAVVEQESTTDVPMTVLDVVLLGRTPHRPAPDDEDRALDALGTVGMAELAGRDWHTLSGGERQRVHLARALTQQPRLLLLDEPTNHLDIRYQLTLLNVVRNLRVTTLAALHDLNLAAAYCDRLVVLDGGRVAAAGPTEEVLVPEVVRAVFGVDCDVQPHPRTGRPVLTFSPLPESP
ncbi:iron complex transport system ATP-binding protein [Haloactinopolyspora alba]|uniref:Iron complex transport system ATP-binding protein n=1 Tax=Haloactinopolyspora alba TaxID=648780 RepID=A0A2P8E1E3_9ACTN|nr:ATP-binding cassette domain-containing protein [Haloactinopolyspora alba]PSL03259.1 iron complex transport system ATP-binding protein [Haloactinopolyspora alba]